MYVCLYACMCRPICTMYVMYDVVCMSICMSMNACIYVCMYICIYACTYACMHLHVYSWNLTNQDQGAVGYDNSMFICRKRFWISLSSEMFHVVLFSAYSYDVALMPIL